MKKIKKLNSFILAKYKNFTEKMNLFQPKDKETKNENKKEK